MARFMQTFPTIVRVRPNLPGEATVQMQTTQREIKVLDETHFFTQSVPAVLPATSTQEDAFRCVSPYISRVGKGYHAAVIAYGETGSGKTFTLFGNGDGIIPRAATELYQSLSPHINRGRQYVILISSVLIHQEKMYDLLEADPLDHELEIRETEAGISVEGLSEEMAMSAQIFSELFRRVQHGRSLLEKVLLPSKSHVIFHIKVESQKVCRHGTLRKMKLTFCDMAGSEGLGKGADSMHRSLDTFHLVLGAIGSTYVPYRESKLTILLHHALRTTCNTCFIFTISPAMKSIESTIETLKRAGKTATIPLAPEKVKIKVNPELAEALRYEVDILRESMQQFNPAVELPPLVVKKQVVSEVEEVEELLQTILDYKKKQKTCGNASIDQCESVKKQEEQPPLARTDSRKKSEAKGDVSLVLEESERTRQQPAFMTPQAREPIRASASPVYSRAEGRTPATRHTHNSLDLSFDQVMIQPSRTRNERRERNQASFRRAVEQSRKLNPVQSDFARVEAEPSEEVKGMIQAQIRKFEEEREANRRRLELKIKKERDEQDAFRRKLERRPMIEPRPLRPRQAVDRFKRLLE